MTYKTGPNERNPGNWEGTFPQKFPHKTIERKLPKNPTTCDIKKGPETVNPGKIKILMERRFPKAPGMEPSSVVLAELLNVEQGRKFVTWIRNDTTGGMGNGHYFHDTEPALRCARQRAEQDYHERVARELEYAWEGLYD